SGDTRRPRRCSRRAATAPGRSGRVILVASNLNKKIDGTIEAWRNRPIEGDIAKSWRREQKIYSHFFLPHSALACSFTAGVSDDVAEVRGLGFSGARVKHSPPKRLRNASAMAVSGKQNRI